MDKYTALKLHRELWLWLAENPSKWKSDWPRWRFNGGDIDEVEADCFCCEYEYSSCFKPLVIWPGGECEWDDSNYDGLFTRWVESENLKQKSRLANAIANLPENKDIK